MSQQPEAAANSRSVGPHSLRASEQLQRACLRPEYPCNDRRDHRCLMAGTRRTDRSARCQRCGLTGSDARRFGSVAQTLARPSRAVVIRQCGPSGVAAMPRQPARRNRSSHKWLLLGGIMNWVLERALRMATLSVPKTSSAQVGLSRLPDSIADPERIAQLDVRRRDQLGGTLHEYRHAS
jgi:hypothetical protein